MKNKKRKKSAKDIIREFTEEALIRKDVILTNNEKESFNSFQISLL